MFDVLIKALGFVIVIVIGFLLKQFIETGKGIYELGW